MRVQREDLLPAIMIEWRYVGLNISTFPQRGDVGGGKAAQLNARF
jgi:hypothetical protein